MVARRVQEEAEAKRTRIMLAAAERKRHRESGVACLGAHIASREGVLRCPDRRLCEREDKDLYEQRGFFEVSTLEPEEAQECASE